MCLDQDSPSSSPGKHRELATGRGIAAQGGDGHRGRDRPAGFRPRRPTRPRLPPEGHQTHPFLAQGQGTQGKPTRGSPRCCPPGWGRTWASAAGSTGRAKTAVSRGRRRGGTRSMFFVGQCRENVGSGSRAAVRHHVRILRHYPRQRTLCRRDCRPLKCHEPTFTLLSETAICRPRGCSLRLCGSILLSIGGSRLRAG
jgi:hypothetical protein